jgi:hypothetical protein
MNWPTALIKELAARRCIVFLGSGASAASMSQDGMSRPPKWSAYLDGLIGIMNTNTDEPIIRDLIKKEKYLDAAEIIVSNISPANYTNYIRQKLQLPKFQPSAIHEAVFKIDPKIVITTNYDDIYDNYCKLGASSNGYNVCKHNETHLVSDLRSPYRSIVKAHGCISNPSETILSRSQYFEAKHKYSNFYKVLDSLFVTNTILFIGYSLNDPDIHLLLENSNISAIGSHPHYACMPDDMHPTLKATLKRSYNIELIEFPAGNYTELSNGLTELAIEVENDRLVNPI